MTIAANVTRGWEKWSAPQASNNAESYTETMVVPSEGLVADLLERLIRRSNSASGFDRQTLRNIDRDGWGVSETD